MGDPAGVGGELALKAWQACRSTGPVFMALDNPDRLRRLATSLGIATPIAAVTSPARAAALFAGCLPVLPISLEVAAEPGRPDPANAPAVVSSIERAVQLAQAGEVAAVVTNPIHKKTLYAAGFGFPGHTEYLAALTGADGQAVMMLASPALRVVPVTVHLSLRAALDLLSTEAIVATAQTTARALARDFGIASPRLALAGVNPHAGEEGAMGEEDAALVAPAVARLRCDGINARGPLPPDSLFSPLMRPGYDAAICMYHDQALIPIKALEFDRAVNVTLGLPLVRTSPDHGTAFDIAGRGIASETSLVAALTLAEEIARRRAGAPVP
jgi:4-hydroxythreonine-4-phosphate dehydrogenase